jgi:hypothetical protein
MKKILIILFLFVSMTSIAQSLSVRKIGFTYSFDQQSLPEQVNIHEFYGYAGIEKGDNNFTVGVTTEIALLSRLSLRTGLLYANKDYSGVFGCSKCVYYDFMSSFRADYMLRMPERETIKQRYLEVPAVARFYFVSKRLSVYADGGFTGSFLVENENEINRGDDMEVKSNNFILNAEGGVGVSYTIVKVIEISITTVYRNSLTTYIATDDMQLRSFGVVGGISYRFKNVRPE